MRQTTITCDVCGQTTDANPRHQYGCRDVCNLCMLDIDQLILAKIRIHHHGLWKHYHRTLKPALWQDWLPEPEKKSA